MNTQQLARDLWNAIEAQQFDRALGYLTNDFQFSGPVPVPLTGPQWLGVHRAFAAAMPNIAVGYRDGSANDVEATGSIQLSGKHTGELVVPVPGIPRVPATGRTITLPREGFEATVRDGKISSIKVEALPNGGLLGILAQMGVALPDPH